jgi:hypothetical protein
VSSRPILIFVASHGAVEEVGNVRWFTQAEARHIGHYVLFIAVPARQYFAGRGLGATEFLGDRGLYVKTTFTTASSD